MRLRQFQFPMDPFANWPPRAGVFALRRIGHAAYVLLYGMSLVGNPPDKAFAQDAEGDRVAEITPEELYARIYRSSTIDFNNAVGYYVVRNFDARADERNRETISQVKELHEKTLKARIENDQKFGVVTDVEKLRAENRQILAEIAAKHPGRTTTRVERYMIEGQKFRIERVNVSNDLPLEAIRQQVLAGTLDVSQPNIVCWNGDFTAEIIRSTPSPGRQGESYSSVTYEQLGKRPNFMTFGRDAVERDFLTRFTSLGLPLSAEAVNWDGERGVKLQIGASNTVGLLAEFVALPEKGYVVASSTVKNGGAILNDERYSDFVEVEDFGWVPTRMVRSNFALDAQGVPTLRLRQEYLAIDPPKVNIPMPPDTFDLANTKEFQRLRSISPTRDKSAHDVTAGIATFNRRFIFIALNVIVLIVLAILLVLRKHLATHA